jgi:hypothetical protein
MLCLSCGVSAYCHDDDDDGAVHDGFVVADVESSLFLLEYKPNEKVVFPCDGVLTKKLAPESHPTGRCYIVWNKAFAEKRVDANEMLDTTTATTGKCISFLHTRQYRCKRR